MNIISCGHCGVVIDVSRIRKPPIADDEGNVDENTVWDGDELIPLINCPVCSEKITYTEGKHY